MFLIRSRWPRRQEWKENSRSLEKGSKGFSRPFRAEHACAWQLLTHSNVTHCYSFTFREKIVTDPNLASTLAVYLTDIWINSAIRNISRYAGVLPVFLINKFKKIQVDFQQRPPLWPHKAPAGAAARDRWGATKRIRTLSLYLSKRQRSGFRTEVTVAWRRKRDPAR